MKKVLVPVLAIVAALGMVGCVSMTQNIAFNADGSSKVTLDMWVDDLSKWGADTAAAAGTPGTAGTAATAAQPPTEETPAVPEQPPAVEDEMGPAFAGIEGVTIEENWAKYEGEGDARKTHAHLVMSVDKIEKLSKIGVFKGSELSLAKKGGKLAFTQKMLNEQQKKEETSPETDQMMRELFKGYTMTYVVTMPGDVKETNGTLGDDKRTITWQWSLYDFSKMESIELKATSNAK
jgi:uncharacterized protein YceK